MPTETVRYQVVVTGRVTDSATGAPLGGVRVEITTAPAAFRAAQKLRARQHGAAWEGMSRRPDRTWSAADGCFHFTGLGPGSYTLTFSLPGAGTRYGTGRAAVRLEDDGAGGVKRESTRAALRPTTVYGTVTGAEGAPLAMAEVRLQGSAERTFTDADGRYALAGVEAGKRNVRVSARGHEAVTRRVTLSQPGSRRKLDVALVPSGE